MKIGMLKVATLQRIFTKKILVYNDALLTCSHSRTISLAFMMEYTLEPLTELRRVLSTGNQLERASATQTGLLDNQITGRTMRTVLA